jgi:hypothetical protein
MSNSGTGVTLNFKYNQDGLRTQKINGSTTTTYYWNNDDQLTHMTSGSDTLHFYYDGDCAAMITYNGTNYYYIRNLQNDVIGLIDMSGTSVVNYTYDSWGRQLSCTGSLANTLGVAMPLARAAGGTVFRCPTNKAEDCTCYSLSALSLECIYQIDRH